MEVEIPAQHTYNIKDYFEISIQGFMTFFKMNYGFTKNSFKEA